MNFLYPRQITVKRPGAQKGVGFQTAYAGDQTATETVLATDICASIQMKREGQRNSVGAPGDGTRPTWDIFIPPEASACIPQIIDRDVIYDDLGRRFQVVGDYVNSLGYKLRCERLEA